MEGTGYSDDGVTCVTAPDVLGLVVLELVASLCGCCLIQLDADRERSQDVTALVRAGLAEDVVDGRGPVLLAGLEDALALSGDQSVEVKLSIRFNEGSCYLALASYTHDVYDEDFVLLQAMTVFS